MFGVGVFTCYFNVTETINFFLSIYPFFLSLDTESINFDHHLRCGGRLNFEFS